MASTVELSTDLNLILLEGEMMDTFLNLIVVLIIIILAAEGLTEGELLKSMSFYK